MLRDAKVGDKVVSVLYGRGVVIRIEDDEDFPVKAVFSKKDDSIMRDGRRLDDDIAPNCWLATNAPQWLLKLFPEPEEEKTDDRPLFADAKVGDEAFSFHGGWSRIEQVCDDGTVKLVPGGWLYNDGRKTHESVHPTAWPADKVPAEILALHPRPKRTVAKTVEGVCEFYPCRNTLMYANGAHIHDEYPCKISDGNVLARITITYEVEE